MIIDLADNRFRYLSFFILSVSAYFYRPADKIIFSFSDACSSLMQGLFYTTRKGSVQHMPRECVWVQKILNALFLFSLNLLVSYSMLRRNISLLALFY